MAVNVATAQLAGTGEVAIAVMPASNWNNPALLGNLVSAFVVASATAAATLTLRIRQGNGTGGAQVGPNVVYTFAGAAANVPVGGGQFADTSPFGTGPTQGGQYTLTAQASVGATVTPNGGVLELETIAPVS